VLALGLLSLSLAAPGASAAPVVMLGRAGHSWRASDRFLGPDLLPARSPTPARPTAQPPPAQVATAPVLVTSVLRRLRASRVISAAQYGSYAGSLSAATGTLRRLSGTRAVELGAVLGNLRTIAASHQLTPSRLPALFLTLARNRSWWSRGPLLSPGQRVEFAGSELVWEYYPGQGIELQELGSFGKANGLYTAGPRSYPRMLTLLGELLPLASRRAGGIAWEYFFRFEGAAPPWSSAMSQATALQALARAYLLTHRRSLLDLGRRALPLFATPPPAGAGVRTSEGRRYLLYSFAPGERVINGFLQSLIGLLDFARVSGDARAAGLFAAGDAEARAELPLYDTGAWSLYEPGQESTLDYHVLVTGFLHGLCERTRAEAYCATARRFARYLKTPPALSLLTTGVAAQRPAIVRFWVSKVSHVGIVITRGARTVFLTSATFGYGAHRFSLPPLAPGRAGVRLAATDLAGNFSRIAGTVSVGG